MFFQPIFLALPTRTIFTKTNIYEKDILSTIFNFFSNTIVAQEQVKNWQKEKYWSINAIQNILHTLTFLFWRNRIYY